MVGRRTGGATMNQAVKKLPLMLGVVGAIAFAAATPSWAAEKGAAAGADAQAGTHAKATGSSTKMSKGHAASSEGMRGSKVSGQKLSKGELSTKKHISSSQKHISRTHLSSKQSLRTKTRIGTRENLRTRTSIGLREARLRERRLATGSVGVNAGFQDTSFGFGSSQPGFAAGYGYPGYAYPGYAYGAARGCTCAPGYAAAAYPAAGWGWGPGWGWGWGGPGFASADVGFGVSATQANVGVTTTSRVKRGARVSAVGTNQAGMTTQAGMTSQIGVSARTAKKGKSQQMMSTGGGAAGPGVQR